MTQEHLMGGLSIIVFSGLLIYILTSTIKTRFPESAFRPFTSAEEILSYFKISISVLIYKRWILLLPLMCVLSNHIIRFFLFLYQRPDLSVRLDSGMDIDHIFSSSVTLKSALSSLLLTPRILDYGYSGSISGSILFMAIFLVCILAFKFVSEKLQKAASGVSLQNVVFFKKTLIISLIALTAIAFAFLALKLFAGSKIEMVGYTLLGLSVALISLLSLSLFSLIQAFIFFSIEYVLTSKALIFDHLINESLKIFKALFFLNMIFFCVESIQYFLTLPSTFTSFLFSDSNPDHWINVLFRVSMGLPYFYSFFTVITFCVPFFLVFGEQTVIEAFKTNFLFIRDHFLKYFILVGIGTLMIFLPSILCDILKSFVSPFSVLIILFDLLSGTLQLVLAAIFYIAVIKFASGFIPSKNMLSPASQA